jgi:hypothetical protein
MSALNAEEALHHFQQSAASYFEKETWSSLQIEEPQIRLAYELPEGVNGWVKVSGIASGWVIFNAPQTMVQELVQKKVGEVTEGDCDDYMREMASVIVSNTRRELGSGLQVEVPDHGAKMIPSSLLGEKAVYVVTMTWNNSKASMVIALEGTQD